jgi:phage-related protein
LQTTLERILVIIVTIFEKIHTWITSKLNLIKSYWTGVWNSIVEFLTPIAANLIGKVVALFDTVHGWFSDKMTVISKTWSDRWNDMVKIIDTIKQAILDKIGGFIDAGKNIAAGIWEGIKGVWDSIVQKVRGLIDKLLTEIEDALGISSPSEVTEALGVNFGLGFINGIDKSLAGLGDKVMASINVPVIAMGGLVPSPVASSGSIGSRPGASTNITFNISGSDPKEVARQVVTLLKLNGIQSF